MAAGSDSRAVAIHRCAVLLQRFSLRSLGVNVLYFRSVDTFFVGTKRIITIGWPRETGEHLDTMP